MFLSLNSKVHTVGYGDRFVYSTIKYFACAKPKSHGVDKNGCVCTHFTWLTHLTFNPVKKKKGTKKQANKKATHSQAKLKKRKKRGDGSPYWTVFAGHIRCSWPTSGWISVLSHQSHWTSLLMPTPTVQLPLNTRTHTITTKLNISDNHSKLTKQT